MTPIAYTMTAKRCVHESVMMINHAKRGTAAVAACRWMCPRNTGRRPLWSMRGFCVSVTPQFPTKLQLLKGREHVLHRTMDSDTLWGMCRAVTCKKCGKASWAGCGAHVEQVLGGVPMSDRCSCNTVSARSEKSSSRKGVLSRLFGKE